MEAYVAAGKSLVFFPPSGTGAGAGVTTDAYAPVFGLSWGDWSSSEQDGGATVKGWRRDSDLFADTQDGSALPLGELRIYQWRDAVFDEGSAEPTVLGRLSEKGVPLLLRAVAPSLMAADSSGAGGAVHVCTTLPQASHSNLARDGVILFAALHRALGRGAEALSGANHRLSGREALADAEEWEVVAGGGAGASAPAEVFPSSERGLLPGVFSSAAVESDETGARLVAVNRPPEEDTRSVVSASDLEALFSGLDYEQITLSVDDRRSLVSEIWRAFLIAMALALVIEAFLCLPALKKSIAVSRSPGAEPEPQAGAGAS
jgi:hypothetical protein